MSSSEERIWMKLQIGIAGEKLSTYLMLPKELMEVDIDFTERFIRKSFHNSLLLGLQEGVATGRISPGDEKAVMNIINALERGKK